MNNNIENNELKNTAINIYDNYVLCDNCFGRLFSKINIKDTNRKKGEDLRKQLKISNYNQQKNCWLCSGLLENKSIFVKIIYDKLKHYDFNTFLLGSIIDEEIIKKEKTLLETYKLDFFESIKVELNREIGLILEDKLSRKVDFENPQIMIIIDTQFYVISLQIKSLYIFGRYKKLKRGIPQTKWFCRTCNGIGCKKCNYLGKLYEESVEELISKPILTVTKGDKSSFHGAGREDIDVKMLGNGRPFILEIKNPIIRKINLDDLKKTINIKNIGKIKVENLRYVDKEEIKIIKTKEYNKTYRVLINGKKSFNIEKLKKAAQSLQGKIISQYTPTRVALRRANIVRDRKIYEIDIESVDKKYATIKITSQSGTYIKELITGDNGRTKPNLSELIGFQCEVKKLDVIDIKE